MLTKLLMNPAGKGKSSEINCVKLRKFNTTWCLGQMPMRSRLLPAEEAGFHYYTRNKGKYLMPLSLEEKIMLT